MSKLLEWLIPRKNPYWHKNIAAELEYEQREKLLEIVRPTAKDWNTLGVTHPCTICSGSNPKCENYKLSTHFVNPAPKQSKQKGY